MSGGDREAILQRARKLAAFNEANATPAEVANAARILKRMLQKYQLSMKDVQAGLVAEGVERREVFSAGRIYRWRRHLIAGVTRYFDCEMVCSVEREYSRLETIYLVGCLSDVQVAAYCCTALAHQLEMAVQALRPLGVPVGTLRESVALGVVDALDGRRDADSAGSAVETTTPQEGALVVVKGQLVARELGRLFPRLERVAKKVKPKEVLMDPTAYATGHEIGTRAAMVGGIEKKEVGATTEGTEGPGKEVSV